MKPLTVADLIYKLEMLDPHAAVWMFSEDCGARPVFNLIASTTGDPFSGRDAGDPKGAPVAMLTSETKPKLRKGETLK